MEAGVILASPRWLWPLSFWALNAGIVGLNGQSLPRNCSARQESDTDQHGFDGYTQIHPEKSARIRPIRGNPRPISSPLGSSLSSYPPSIQCFLIILGYETSPAAGDWNRNVLFGADDLEGGGGNFYTLSDAIADGYADPPTNTVKFLPAPYVPQEICLGQTCPDEEPSVVCRQQIVNTINTTGALLVNFIGRSTKFYWARERLMDYGALVGLTNGDKLFISLPMTCLEGYFHEAQIGVHSFGEMNVRLAGGGAVASWSPSGLGVATGHDMLERGFFLALFHDGVQELGPATNQAKLYLLPNSPPGRYRDIVDTYLVLGDPALRVRLAEP